MAALGSLCSVSRRSWSLKAKSVPSCVVPKTFPRCLQVSSLSFTETKSALVVTAISSVPKRVQRPKAPFSLAWYLPSPAKSLPVLKAVIAWNSISGDSIRREN